VPGPETGGPASALAGAATPPGSPAVPFNVGAPSTSAAALGSGPPEPTHTFQALFAEAEGRPLLGPKRQTRATRRMANLVRVFKEKGVTASKLPDYPGMHETSRLLGFKVPYSTIASNANKVLHRPNMSQQVKDYQIEVLKVFGEWSPDAASS
jgi:hypothetical protein